MIEQIYIISYNVDDNYKPRSGKQSDNIASHVCMKKLQEKVSRYLVQVLLRWQEEIIKAVANLPLLYFICIITNCILIKKYFFCHYKSVNLFNQMLSFIHNYNIDATSKNSVPIHFFEQPNIISSARFAPRCLQDLLDIPGKSEKWSIHSSKATKFVYKYYKCV